MAALPETQIEKPVPVMIGKTALEATLPGSLAIGAGDAWLVRAPVALRQSLLPGGLQILAGTVADVGRAHRPVVLGQGVVELAQGCVGADRLLDEARGLRAVEGGRVPEPGQQRGGERREGADDFINDQPSVRGRGRALTSA